jgi:hypothetical protein
VKKATGYHNRKNLLPLLFCINSREVKENEFCAHIEQLLNPTLQIGIIGV